ncbi:MAG TPA: ATP-binding protein, partial [Allocoleopsis sp.]
MHPTFGTFFIENPLTYLISMTVTEFLQLVDQLVFEQTEKHLSDLQKKVVLGILQGKTYNQIAQDFGYDSENYIGNICRDLYKILSDKLGEDINKHNFCWTIERVKNSKFSQFSKLVNFENNNINWCPHNQTTNNHQPVNTEKPNNIYQDLKLAPKIINFYNRENELKTLYNWIFNQNTPLISVLGLSGIGKTALVKRFVDLNLEKFEVIIWKNLKFYQSLNDMITEVLTVLIKQKNQTSEILKSSAISNFLDLLKEKKCLIILDDVQNIFISGELAGQYQTEYKDYQNLFTMITEIEHQSNVILISQEKCSEMNSLDDDLSPVKSLELTGLEQIDILKNYKLKDSLVRLRSLTTTTLTNHEDSWLNLMNLYSGNPGYIKDIIPLIKDIYQGQVSEFLTESGLTLTENIKFRLNELFNRLSSVEIKIILQLSKFDQPISREELGEGLEMASNEIS